MLGKSSTRIHSNIGSSKVQRRKRNSLILNLYAIYTCIYFLFILFSSSTVIHSSFLRSEEWEAIGFDTHILTMEDAKKHPLYDKMESVVKPVFRTDYNAMCFYRWLAMANHGGWMSDYDTYVREWWYLYTYIYKWFVTKYSPSSCISILNHHSVFQQISLLRKHISTSQHNVADCMMYKTFKIIWNQILTFLHQSIDSY